MTATERFESAPERTLRPSGAGRRRYVVERLAKTVLGLAAAVTLATTVGIFVSLLRPTLAFFDEVSIGEFLSSDTWAPLFTPPEFGVRPIVQGTFIVTAIALTVALPAGLGTAFYLSEYARPRVRRTLKPILEILGGIPTVAFGFFALHWVNPHIVQQFWPFGEPGTFSALSAGLVMGVMILPIVASLSEDAMSAVPNALREGAYALGSTRREVCTQIVFPAALSGIIAAAVLAVSRAVGETMIVLIASGSRPTTSLNPGEGMQTMASFIGFAGIGDQPTNSTGYRTIFAVGSLLFAMTLALNLISARVSKRFREAYE